jgi:hypothetical protein
MLSLGVIYLFCYISKESDFYFVIFANGYRYPTCSTAINAQKHGNFIKDFYFCNIFPE